MKNEFLYSSDLAAKYQFCTIHTADTTASTHSTDGIVTNRALLSIESEKVHRLYPPAAKT